MGTTEDSVLEELVEKVCEGERYREIDRELVRAIGLKELRDRRTLRDAVKATRSKLHQVGGAYLQTVPDYQGWARQLAQLPGERENSELRSFCLHAMRSHSSTRERMPILDQFYSTIFKELPAVHSVLDLACGLNPLAIPWMPLTGSDRYLACDIYGDMVAFLGNFFAHLRQDGRAWSCDLSRGMPEESVDLALLLKSIPCLEQLDRDLPGRLLDGIRAKYMLVSFPVASLGGIGKGMRAHYESHFMTLLSGKNWRIKRYEFGAELAFLVEK